MVLSDDEMPAPVRLPTDPDRATLARWLVRGWDPGRDDALDEAALDRLDERTDRNDLGQLSVQRLESLERHWQLKERGLTILLVEQNFRFASTVADRFYVMEHGEIVHGFHASELEANMPKLHEYLGV